MSIVFYSVYKLKPVLLETFPDSYVFCLFVFFVPRPAPKNEDEMMVAIFEYIDRLFNIVRPRRVLYMAIDGVVSTRAQRDSWFVCVQSDSAGIIVDWGPLCGLF